MKYVLLVLVAVIGTLGVLAMAVYLLRQSRLFSGDGSKSFRYIRLSQTADQATQSQCLVNASTDEEDDDDDESSPATIDVESRTVEMNGQAYCKAKVVEDETDEELLQ